MIPCVAWSKTFITQLPPEIYLRTYLSPQMVLVCNYKNSYEMSTYIFE